METKFTVFGGYSVGVTPVLIPNTEVKSYRADDTAWETVWESRSPPKLFVRASYPLDMRPFYLPRQSKLPGKKLLKRVLKGRVCRSCQVARKSGQKKE